jgi:carbon storage regulator CsrA
MTKKTRTKNPPHKWRVPKTNETGNLCISREPGQSLLIGDNIEVLVLRIRGQMAVNIRAPKNLKIVRSELLERDAVEGQPQG